MKRYSSGMYVRLAFAVAAHLEPEILLVDEVLAVGDAAFQKKCLGKMEDVSQKGRTVSDDWICAFCFKSDAEQFYRALPERLSKFKLEVAPEKTQILRFSRFHPSMKRRFTLLGFEFFWKEDRKGVPRVMRRTARKKLQGACGRIKEWIKSNRHLPGKEFFRRLNVRLRGHYNYYGIRGNSESLRRFFNEVIECTFKWLNRRGCKRTSFLWEKFKDILERIHIVKPFITEVKHRRVFA